ncbi:hypothetical protein J6590_072111 [Homalodisca vitripennis]|nr:hypothetical protein J6590_072111 [Homalodisca vitripennis]
MYNFICKTSSSIPAQPTRGNIYYCLEKIALAITVPFKREDFSTAHRLRLYSKKHVHPPIIAQFVSRKMREEWLTAARRTRNLNASDIDSALNNSPVFINEHLTAHNKAILGRARRLQREKKISFVGFFNGKILFKVAKGAETERVTMLADLDKFDNTIPAQDKPTRVTNNCSSCLDHIFLRYYDMNDAQSAVLQTGVSDHYSSGLTITATATSPHNDNHTDDSTTQCYTDNHLLGRRPLIALIEIGCFLNRRPLEFGVTPFHGSQPTSQVGCRLRVVPPTAETAVSAPIPLSPLPVSETYRTSQPLILQCYTPTLNFNSVYSVQSVSFRGGKPQIKTRTAKTERTAQNCFGLVLEYDNCLLTFTNEVLVTGKRQPRRRL